MKVHGVGVRGIGIQLEGKGREVEQDIHCLTEGQVELPTMLYAASIEPVMSLAPPIVPID